MPTAPSPREAVTTGSLSTSTLTEIIFAEGVAGSPPLQITLSKPLRDRAHNCIIDTRGRTGVVTDWGRSALSGNPVGGVNVNSTVEQFVAFGPVVNSVFIDDVVVERDALPVEAAASAPTVANATTPATVAPAPCGGG